MFETPRRSRLFWAPLAVTALVALTACGGSDASALQAQAVHQATVKLDTLVPQWMARTGVPGVAVAVVYRGQTIYVKGFGVRRVGESAPVDADTVFQLASVSKSISATVMATQMPGGADVAGHPTVTWNTPIQMMLPWFQLDYADPAMDAQLTLGDLFAHRSGLPGHAGDQLEDLGYGRSDILRRLDDVPVEPIGTAYDYTNFGLTAAAEAMAEADMTDWATLAQTALYQPLGMTSTSSRYADFTARSDRAWGHVQVDQSYANYGEMPATYEVQNPPRDPDAQAPAGGVSSSARDMASWMKLVLAGGSWQGRQLLSPTALQAAMTGQSNGGKYGFGFNVGTDPEGHPAVSHSGAFTMGAATEFILWPEADLGITVLTNAQPRGLPEAIAVAFGEAALGDAPGNKPGTDWLEFMQNLPDFHDMYKPFGKLAGQQPPASPTPPSAPLASYVGNYTNAYYGTAQVAMDADGQSLDLIMGPATVRYHLVHWNGDEFAFSLQSENAAVGSISAVKFSPQQMQIEYFSQDLENGLFERQ